MSGCDYQGHEFGASYLDSVCINGYLWDADSCEEPGGPLHNGGEEPCPKCNHDEWLSEHSYGVEEMGYIAQNEGKPITDCPFPQEAKEHIPGDGAIFRYLWLKGFADAVLENTPQSTGSSGK